MIKRKTVGEKNGSSKLTWDAVKEIRELYILKKYTQSELANKFGMSQGRISDIVTNTSWKDPTYKYLRYKTDIASMTIEELKQLDFLINVEMIKRRKDS